MATKEAIGENILRDLGGLCGEKGTPEEAVRCIAESLQKVSDRRSPDCGHSLVLLTRDGCSFCSEAKETYAPLITAGLIELQDATKGTGLHLMDRNSLDVVPILGIFDCAGDLVSALELPAEYDESVK